MQTSLDHQQIKQACDQVYRALATPVDEPTERALRASLRILRSLLPAGAADRAPNYAGCLDYIFDDDECPPYCRQIVVRIWYDWADYNPADEPHAPWGATIENIEVLAVRYLDRRGEETTLGEHHQDLARLLLGRDEQIVVEACTEDGFRKGVGKAPGWFAPGQATPVLEEAPLVARMAPSQTRRGTSGSRQRWA